MSNSNRQSGFYNVMTVFGRVLAIVLETVLLVVLIAYCVMRVLCYGPSESARNMFVTSVRETSAIGFLADIYFTEDEIAAIEKTSGKSENEDVVTVSAEYIETDTSLISIAAGSESAATEGADAWGLVDDDGDGIILEQVKGEGFSGYMMVVLDPSRVIMGSVPDSFGRRGYTVAEMVEHYDAVAGINAGGFLDPNGKGNGSTPDSLVVFGGKTYYADFGCRNGFVGFDENNIMHVGMFKSADVADNNIQTGVCFGPILIQNGVAADPDTLNPSVNPRTAIGQRSDGAVLLLVIDGRQVISLGATYQDEVDIMLQYGAVNACNLDGGSSTLMWYEGGYINNCASVVGIRPVPTTFLVLKEGVKIDG